MRTLVQIYTACSILLTLTLAPISHGNDDEKAILALYDDWKVSVESGDIEGYIRGLHSDISLRPPGAQGLDGRDNYRRFLQPVFKNTRYEIIIKKAPNVSLIGNTAIVEYDYTVHRHTDSTADTKLPDGALVAETTTSHYIDVVTKDSEGLWLVRLHSWHQTS